MERRDRAINGYFILLCNRCGQPFYHKGIGWFNKKTLKMTTRYSKCKKCNFNNPLMVCKIKEEFPPGTSPLKVKAGLQKLLFKGIESGSEQTQFKPATTLIINKDVKPSKPPLETIYFLFKCVKCRQVLCIKNNQKSIRCIQCNGIVHLGAFDKRLTIYYSVSKKILKKVGTSQLDDVLLFEVNRLKEEHKNQQKKKAEAEFRLLDSY